MKKVFISYRQSDRAFATNLRTLLKERGYLPWMDVFDIPVGSHWNDAIDSALNDADIVVGLLSPESVKSRNVKNEWDWALRYDTPLILLMITECRIPMHYVSINYIDYTKNIDNGLSELFAAIEVVEKIVSPLDPTSATVDVFEKYLHILYDRITHSLKNMIVNKREPAHLRSERTLERVLSEQEDNIDPLLVITGQQAEVPNTFDDFGLAFEFLEKRVLLLGAPGSGKTTTLLQFARDSIIRRLNDSTQPLPILGFISTWNPNEQPTISDWLARSYGAPPYLHELVLQGQALLLLDGLDELGNEFAVQGLDPSTQKPVVIERFDPRARFIDLLPQNNAIVVSCRSKDFDQIGERINLNGAVTLQPLSEDQLNEYLGDQIELLSAVYADVNLRQLVETPLLLGIFAFGYKDISQSERYKLKNFAASPGELREQVFDTYVKRRYEHEARKLKLRQPPQDMSLDLDTILPVLQQIAVSQASQSKNSFSFTEVEVAFGNDPETFIELVQKLHLIFMNEEGRYSFIHLLLRDYFAFRVLLVGVKFEDPNTRAVVATTLGKMGDDRAISYLAELLEDPIWDVKHAAARALAAIGSSAVAALGKFISHPEVDIRNLAAGALIKIGASSLQPLLDCLTSLNEDVKRTAVQAIGEIKDERGGIALEELLRNAKPSSYTRKIIIEALEKIGKPSALPVICSSLLDFNKEVRVAARKAVISFGKTAFNHIVQLLNTVTASDVLILLELVFTIDPENAVDILVSYLDYPNEDVVLYCIECLGKHSNKNTTAALVQFLENDDIVFKLEAKKALRSIGSRTLDDLVQVLHHDKSVIQINIIDILGELRANSTVEELIQLSESGNDEIKTHCIIALGHIGNEKCIRYLITCIATATLELRKTIQECLGKLRNGQSVQVLFPHIVDQNLEVRPIIKNALLQIAATLIDPFVASITTYSDPEIIEFCREAIIAAGDLNPELLVGCLNDKDFEELIVLSTAIMKVGIKTVPALRKFVQSETQERGSSGSYRHYVDNQTFLGRYAPSWTMAVLTLGQFGDDFAIEPLSMLLEERVGMGDSQYLVSDLAAQLLRNFHTPKADAVLARWISKR